MRRVAFLLLLLALPGCFGPAGLGHACGSGGTLDLEWDEPGLHDALAAATPPEGVRVEPRGPGEPRVRNASLQARWGPVALVEAAYRPGGYVESASLARDPWPEGDLRLGVSVPRGSTAEDAAGLARTLLDRLGVPGEDARAHAEAVRAAFRGADPGVENAVASVAWTGRLDADAVPERLFRDAEPEADGMGTLRRLAEGPWLLVVALAPLRVEDGDVRLDVAPDDRVAGTVQMPGTTDPAAGRDRINATLARLGLPPSTFRGYEGGVMTC